MERTRANKQTGARCEAVVGKVQGTGEEEHSVEDSQPGMSAWDASWPTCIVTYQYEYALLLNALLKLISGMNLTFAHSN